MPIERKDCAAVILAGGLSRRMGRCKATLLLDGETMLQRTARCLDGFPELLISANDPALGDERGRVVPDEYPGQGPMAGLHAVMGATEKTAVLCLPCDLPFFTVEAVERLLREYGGEDALVLTDSTGRVHPLCGIYACSLRPRMGEMLEAGERRILELLRRTESRFLSPGSGISDRVFLNMNTPEEYAAVIGGGISDRMK